MGNFGAIEFDAWEARALMSLEASLEQERAQARELAGTAYFASLAAGALAGVEAGEIEADEARDAAFRTQVILSVAEIGDRLDFEPFRRGLPQMSAKWLWRNVASSLSEICATLRLPLGYAWHSARYHEHGAYYNPERRVAYLAEMFRFADRNLCALAQA